MPKVALQLYTVREDMARDFEGTIRAVARMGYPAIETGGALGTPDDHLIRLLNETGLSVAGLGYTLEQAESEPDAIAEYCHALNCQYAITYWIDESQRRSKDDWKRLAERFQRAGEQLASRKIRYIYHLHGYEFMPLNSTTGVEILLSETNPEHFNLEPDTYWVEYGGVDAVEFCARHANRIRCVHLKDYLSKPDMHDIEIGEGTIDMHSIVRLAFQHNWDWLVVEQERYFRSPLESAERCLHNLNAIIARTTSEA